MLESRNKWCKLCVEMMMPMVDREEEKKKRREKNVYTLLLVSSVLRQCTDIVIILCVSVCMSSLLTHALS